MPRRRNEPETLNERIRAAGWYSGTEQTWWQLTSEERERIAFDATGCAVAYPTWERPVECVHTCCRIRRGELPAIAQTNSIVRYEAEYGYLRSLSRAALAKVFRALRQHARQCGAYDPWKNGSWQVLVSAGIWGE